MKLGIIGAMPQEISKLLENIEVTANHKFAKREFIEGTLNGVEVVLALSRVGKTSSAITTTLLITKFNVDQVIFTGVAGAIDPELNIGDIVIGNSFVHHDMDASPIYPKFEIPLLGISTFSADKLLVNKLEHSAIKFTQDIDSHIDKSDLEEFGSSTPKIVTGSIVSGDQFIKSKEQAEAITSSLSHLGLPTLRCTEMEGASVAQTCYELDVPVSIVRVISDKSNENSPIDFNRFIENVACHLTGGIVAKYCETIMTEELANSYSMS